MPALLSALVQGEIMTSRKIIATTTWTALALFPLSPLAAQSPAAQSATNIPKGVGIAADLGPVDRNQPQTLTVVLKTHNQAAYDKAVEDLYDPESSTYRQWFS